MSIETFKKSQLFFMEKAIFNLKNVKDLHLAEILKKNYDVIKPHIDEIKETVKPTGRYKEYVTQMSAIGLRKQCQYCGHYSVDVPIKLADQYRIDILDYQMKLAEYENKLNQETVELDITKIDMATIDKEFNENTRNSLTYEIINSLSFMIK